jgi:hypothetical protein
MLAQNYPVIHMYLHSSSLLPGSTRYVQSEQDKTRLMQRIEKVVSFLRSQCDVETVTITDAALKLKKQGVLKAHG